MLRHDAALGFSTQNVVIVKQKKNVEPNNKKVK
jgi:hypothetical protein